ncbi:uncharacterized protein ARMOST_17240 [Armillaria ostoyae]|uniref:Fatty acid synthase beta subunit AflB /Fas1-like central domain-containing protein n=1 Tax=Armillaria ostoyae TaxID=47428 RepID=A0A284RYG2_ARMOS|nr:uncharacterized protein ARMOST_17240 [Armillaria ostoyae]
MLTKRHLLSDRISDCPLPSTALLSAGLTLLGRPFCLTSFVGRLVFSYHCPFPTILTSGLTLLGWPFCLTSFVGRQLDLTSYVNHGLTLQNGALRFPGYPKVEPPELQVPFVSLQGAIIRIQSIAIFVGLLLHAVTRPPTTKNETVQAQSALMPSSPISRLKAGFVSAVLDAGYHIELAGGAHYNAAALPAKVAEIQAKIPDVSEMRKEGLPIEGFCVAAGIPTTEKAVEIIDSLRNAGIKHVSFKPGSIDGIRQVINIAAANPNFPIILQWTGGRAGGHHSYEDFHQPILVTYRVPFVNTTTSALSSVLASERLMMFIPT